MRTLLQKYQEQLLTNGISTSDAENYHSEKLKKRLTGKYGSSLIFALQKIQLNLELFIVATLILSM